MNDEKKKRIIQSIKKNFIIVAFFLLVVFFGDALTSSEIDMVCSQNESFLFRFNGSWGCAKFNDTITININNITNIIQNYSLIANSSYYWDNLNTPSDIPESVWWINQTIALTNSYSQWWKNQTADLFNAYNSVWGSTYNSTYNSIITNGANSTSWIRNGTNVHLKNNNDKVGIGIKNPDASLDISGVTVGKAFQVSGGIAQYSNQKIYVNEYGTLGIVGLSDAASNLLFGALNSTDTFARIGFGFDNGIPFFGFGSGTIGRDIFLRRESGNLTFTFGTNPIEKMRITNKGSIQITGNYKVNNTEGITKTINLNATCSITITSGIITNSGAGC